MVGVPRSKGCSTCIRRRVKCDETLPSCGNCIRYGVDCPGYDKGLKFVAGKHDVKPRAPRQGAKTNTPPTGPPQGACETILLVRGISSLSPTSSASRVPSGKPDEEEEYQNTRPCFAFYAPPPHGGASTTNRAQYITTMIDVIRAAESRSDLLPFEHWFDAVAPRLGSKASLDSSTCAFTLHLLGKIKKDRIALAHSRQLYGQSLAELQRALSHHTEWKSSETLCSAMLLGVYELFAGTAPRSWRRHANGIARLMQHRGAKSFYNQWDWGLLLSYRGLLIASSIFEFEECFLAKKQWRPLCDSAEFSKRYLDQTNASDDAITTLEIADQHLMALADLTLQFKDMQEYHSGLRHRLEVDPAQKAALQSACEKQISTYKKWYEMLTEERRKFSSAPVEVPSEDPESIFPVVLRFDNPWAGTVFLGFWACMFLYKFTLWNLDADKYPCYRAEAEKHREDILKSLEFIAKGVSGLYRIGFGIRLIFEFSSPMEQAWLRGVLRRAKPMYGSVNPELYPPQKVLEPVQVEIERATAANISWESFTESI
ncbi:C6 zinc finger domain protein [Zalerion maritima]|uniref:C6 zinc finger domain protein n=1 Tax=Zalerion maritima TaxID=339359 RepID=A0AAD5WV94_9PEZI|nr:C6 zinc finger domain protein [Zalerion maritima]